MELGSGGSAFIGVALLWGVPYLFIEIAVEGGASPILVGWGRVAIGAAILLPIAWKLGYLEGLRSKTKPLVAFAIAECALPWWLIRSDSRRSPRRWRRS